MQLWNLLKLLTQRRWNNFTATRMVCRGRSWAFSLHAAHAEKNGLCQNKEFESFHDEISPDGGARLLEIGYRIARKCSPLAGMWQVWFFLSRSPTLSLPVSYSLSLSPSLLRSADSVQGTPAAGFWVRIYISLNIRQRGSRNTGRDRKRSHLSQMLADWSGGSLSKEFDQNKLARREPETHAAFLANWTKNRNSNLPSFWQQMACVLWNDCLASEGKINTKLLTPSTSERNLASPLTLRIN